MKVMQINCVYNKGSTGKIMCDIHSHLLSQQIDSVICYGRGEKTTDCNVYKTCGEWYSKFNNLLSRFSGLMYGGCFLSTKKLISIIKKEKPDIIHLQCINGYFVNIYKLITWLKKEHIKTVLTLHAEFMYTANCAHALECEKWKTGCGNCSRFKTETKSIFIDATAKSFKKMKKAFEGFEKNCTIVSVSPWLMDRAKASLILKDFEHRVVLNGLDTDVFKPCDTEDIKKELGITNEKVVFHATPNFSDDPNHIKGGFYILKLAEALKEKNVKVVVAGRYDSNITVPENVILLGNVPDQRLLAKYYSMADVTVIASKKETFSMIVAESLCCGTPVVGFKAGAPEQIALSQYTEFSEYGDVESFIKNVIEMLEKDKNPDEIYRNAKQKYSKEEMASNYIKVYINDEK